MNTSLIILATIGFYLLFIWKGGKTFPLMYLFLFVYFIQYIFSVYLTYNEYPVLRREMAISQEQLFEYLVPAMACMFLGVFLFNRDVDIKEYIKRIRANDASNLGHLLVIFSFACDLLPYLDVPGIRSIISFTYYLRYAGAMCYLFSLAPLNIALIIFIYLGLLWDALRGGIFVDFLVWTAYIFLLFTMKFEWTFKTRSTFILIAAPLLIVIQTIKYEYRQATWTGKRESGVGLFTELAEEKKVGEESFASNSDGVISTVGRLNQGWQLGKVLKHVPRYEAFSNGEDMVTDLEGVLLPRIFYPDKKVIGSQDKFEKFTGHKLIGSTSMTIGIFGDFYVNFGRTGSFIAAFIFGALMSWLLYRFTIKYVLPDPINIVWIPYLFTYLIRANNDFYIVVNHMFKGYLIFLFANYLRHQLWPKTRTAFQR